MADVRNHPNNVLSLPAVFTPDARNATRQRYCSKPACRKQSKVESQLRWLQKPENRDYFRGAEHVLRVQRWRAAHPGYWRGSKRSSVALQDSLIAHPDLSVYERISDE